MKRFDIRIRGSRIHNLDELLKEIIRSVEAAHRIYKYKHPTGNDWESIHIVWDCATSSLENIPHEYSILRKSLQDLAQKYGSIYFEESLRKEVILEGKTIHSESDFHHQIAALLDFPAFYGENLNALWDLMTGHTDTNIHLIWKDSDDSRQYLGESFKDICELFIEVTQMYPEFKFETKSKHD